MGTPVETVEVTDGGRTAIIHTVAPLAHKGRERGYAEFIGHALLRLGLHGIYRVQLGERAPAGEATRGRLLVSKRRGPNLITCRVHPDGMDDRACLYANVMGSPDTMDLFLERAIADRAVAEAPADPEPPAEQADPFGDVTAARIASGLMACEEDLALFLSEVDGAAQLTPIKSATEALHAALCQVRPEAAQIPIASRAWVLRALHRAEYLKRIGGKGGSRRLMVGPAGEALLARMMPAPAAVETPEPALPAEVLTPAPPEDAGTPDLVAPTPAEQIRAAMAGIKAQIERLTERRKALQGQAKAVLEKADEVGRDAERRAITLDHLERALAGL